MKYSVLVTYKGLPSFRMDQKIRHAAASLAKEEGAGFCFSNRIRDFSFITSTKPLANRLMRHLRRLQGITVTILPND